MYLDFRRLLVNTLNVQQGVKVSYFSLCLTSRIHGAIYIRTLLCIHRYQHVAIQMLQCTFVLANYDAEENDSARLLWAYKSSICQRPLPPSFHAGFSFIRCCFRCTRSFTVFTVNTNGLSRNALQLENEGNERQANGKAWAA